MTHRYEGLAAGRRTQLRMPMSPVKAQLALKALEEWRLPEDGGRERGWYRITSAAEGQAPTQVNIYDEISWWGISAQDFVDAISAVPGDLEVHINSPGGDLFDGVTIYNALASRPGVVSVVVDGLAASAASLIAMAGETRVMSPGSMLMIHDALAMTIGNEADHLASATVLGKASSSAASIYAAASGTPAPQWRAAMQAENWYTAEEAVAAGLATTVTERAAAGEPGTGPEAGWSRSIFAAWQGRPKAAGQGCGCCGSCTSPGDGCCASCRPANAAADDHGHPGQDCWDGDGDGDCDLAPGGDTDHDYWGEDGEQLQPVPGKPMEDRAAGIRDAAHKSGADSVDESAWDGPAAMAAALKADDPAAAFAGICAAELTEGDPGEEQHWALPHHKHAGDAPNRKGVSSALGYLDRTQHMKDPAAARAHLEAHQKAMGGGDSTDDHAGIDLGALAAGLKGAFA